MIWSQWSSVAAVFIGGLLLFASWKRFSRKLRLPPGPPGWPVLGHLLILGSRPHLSLMKLSQKYGPLMFLKLGSVPLVVASSARMAKILLRTQDHIFAGRPPSLTGEVLLYNYQDLSFAPYNDHWRRTRRIVESSIFSPKRLQSFEKLRDEEILGTVKLLLLAGRDGSLVEIDSHITQSSLDIMSRICFTKRLFASTARVNVDSSESTDEPSDFRSLLAEASLTLRKFSIGEYIPLLRKLDLGGVEAELWRLRAKYDKFLIPIIEEYRQKPDGDSQDFLSLLLAAQRDQTEHQISDETIIGLLENMLAAGTETTSYTTIWAVSELMRHPEALRKVLDELDSIVGRDRLVETADLVSLKYLKAVVKETFRMYPAAPLGVPHESMQDTEIAGYQLRKGTRVIVNLYALGRDPAVWKDPNCFDPERFLDSPIDIRGQHFEVLPFGAGRRKCPGVEMGVERVEMTLAQLLHTCSLHLPAGVEVDVDEGVGFTLPRAHPLQTLVTPRLQSEVYTRYGITLLM
ncbi:hypothetical protein R1sor_022185 [Riccia sorocarpa]|uniref:Cytochrome P450 n=1 Tax=Riccia sorocarpa TaxID=122646 RepID=A0ABD3GLB6_9MARC